MNQLKAGGSQEFAPRSSARGPVGLTEVCVEAGLKARSNLLGPKVLESPLLGYKRLQGGFEGALVGKEVTIGASQGLEG